MQSRKMEKKWQERKINKSKVKSVKKKNKRKLGRGQGKEKWLILRIYDKCRKKIEKW